MEYIGWFFVLGFILPTIGFFGFPKDSKVRKACLNILLGYDQLGNTFLLGDPDETISSRAYKERLNGNKYWTLLADFLDWLDPNHTLDSVEWDEGTKKTDTPLDKGTNK